MVKAADEKEAYTSRERSLERARALMRGELGDDAGDRAFRCFEVARFLTFMANWRKGCESRANHAARVLGLEREAPDPGTADARASIERAEERLDLLRLQARPTLPPGWASTVTAEERTFAEAVVDRATRRPGSVSILPMLPEASRAQRTEFARVVLTYWRDLRKLEPAVWAYFGIGVGLDAPTTNRKPSAREGFRVLRASWSTALGDAAKKLGLRPSPNAAPRKPKR